MPWRWSPVQEPFLCQKQRQLPSLQPQRPRRNRRPKGPQSLLRRMMRRKRKILPPLAVEWLLENVKAKTTAFQWLGSRFHSLGDCSSCHIDWCVKNPPNDTTNCFWLLKLCYMSMLYSFSMSGKRLLQTVILDKPHEIIPAEWTHGCCQIQAKAVKKKPAVWPKDHHPKLFEQLDWFIQTNTTKPRSIQPTIFLDPLDGISSA